MRPHYFLSEAEKQELVNQAAGEAEAVVAAGRARMESIKLVASSLQMDKGQDAAALAVAEKYVGAFQVCEQCCDQLWEITLLGTGQDQ